MNKKVILALVVTIAVATSCTRYKDTSIVVEKFPVEEVLDSLKSLCPQLGEYGSTSIGFAGDYLVMRTIKSPFFFALYDTNFNLVDTVVRKGQGPDEMTSPMFYGQWSGVNAHPSILVFEDAKNRMYEVGIHPFDGIKMVGNLPVSEYLSPSRIFWLPDSTFVGINLEIGHQSQLFTYNLRTKGVVKIPHAVEFDGPQAFYTSQCNLAVMGDGECYAITYINVPLICIFNSKFELVRKIFICEEVDTKTIAMSERVGGFGSSMFCGDKLIALQISEDTSADNSLLVFDTTGDPKGKFDVGKALSFAISPDMSNILTVEYDTEADMVRFVKYALPEILK